LPDLTQPSSFTGLGTGYVETTQGSLPINIGGVKFILNLINLNSELYLMEGSIFKALVVSGHVWFPDKILVPVTLGVY
jgi:hypothetical protein